MCYINWVYIGANNTSGASSTFLSLRWILTFAKNFTITVLTFGTSNSVTNFLSEKAVRHYRLL